VTQPDSFAYAARAEEEGLRTILVGGNAINLHAYFRATFDVDLLVPEGQAERWVSFFQRHGYGVMTRTPNFVRLHFAADPTAALPVDLMLADEQTFERIREQSLRRDIGNGLTLPIPAALHLIAMKLHALRNPARVEAGIDLLDVKHLIKSADIDISGKEFTEIADRYATDAIRSRIQQDFSRKPSA
jgi:hypothetical protein